MAGKTVARGYGYAHRKERARWVPIVARGGVECHAARCLHYDLTIHPDDPWDLGHLDDRTGWTGPEHMDCNRAAGARKKNAQTRTGSGSRPWTRPERDW